MILLLWLVGLSSAGEDFEFARRLYRDGFYGLAALQFERFLREHSSSPEAPEALLLRADALFRSGDWEAALEGYERFLVRYPDDLSFGEALWGRARSLSELGRHLEAARAFLELYRRLPAGERAASALLEAARSFRREGEFDRALETLRELGRAFPSAGRGEEARYERGLCLEALGKLREALREFEGLSSRPEVLRALGRIALALGELDRAEEALKRLEEDFPKEEATALLAFEMAEHALEEGDADRSARWSALALSSPLPDSLRPLALLEAARALRRADRVSRALATCDTFLTAFPGHSLADEVLAERALALLELGREGEARLTAEKLEGSFPMSPSLARVWRGLGDFYRQGGRPFEAIGYYRRCLERTPGEDLALALAELYCSVGWYEEALRIYQGTAWEDSAASAQWGMARCLEEMGDPRALREYQRFRTRFPLDSRAEEAKWREALLRRRSPDLGKALEALAEGGRGALAEVYIALGRPEEAFSLLSRKVEGDTAASDTLLYLLAKSALLSGRKDEASAAYRRLNSLYPENPYAYEASLFLAGEELSRIPEGPERWDAMLSKYGELLKRYPSGDSTDAVLFRIAEAYRGLASFDSSEASRALSWFRRLWTQYPESPYADEALFLAGELALERGLLSYADSALSRLVREYSLSPLFARAYALLGDTALRRGREDLAAAHWERALEGLSGVEREKLSERLAGLYISLGQPEKAIPLYRKLVGTRKTPERLEALASSCERASLKLEAARWYAELLSRYPQVGDSVRVAYGRLLMELGRREEAAEVLKGGDSPEVLSLRAGLLYDLGRYREALEAYSRLAKLGRAEPEVYGRQVLCLIALSREKGARRQIREFRKRFGKGREWEARFELALGEAALGRGEYKKAREHLKKAMKDREYGGQARYDIALSYFKAKETDKAIESFLKFLKAYPESPFRKAAYMHLGTLYYLTGQYALAVDAYKKALSEGASGQEVRFNLALSYERLGRYEAALAALEELEREFPKSPLLERTRVKRGIYLMKLGRYRYAIAHFKTLLPRADRDTQAELWFHIAKAHASLGEYEEAALAYLRIPYLYPEQRLWAVTAKYEAAGVFERMGGMEEARKLYADILKEYGPGSEWGRAASEKLEELR